MSLCSKVLVCLLALCVGILSLHAAPLPRISCDGGEFTRGQEASLTCRFGKDIRDLQRNFYILFHPANHSDTQTRGKQILLCTWNDSEKPECFIEKGYAFDFAVRDQLTLSINTTEDVAGKYECHLVPPDDRPPPDQCKIEIKEVSETAHRTTTTSFTTTQYDNERSGIRWITAFITATSILGLATVLLTLAVLYMCRTRFPERLGKKAKWLLSKTAKTTKESKQSPTGAKISTSQQVSSGKGASCKDVSVETDFSSSFPVQVSTEPTVPFTRKNTITLPKNGKGTLDMNFPEKYPRTSNDDEVDKQTEECTFDSTEANAHENKTPARLSISNRFRLAFNILWSGRREWKEGNQTRKH